MNKIIKWGLVGFAALVVLVVLLGGDGEESQPSQTQPSQQEESSKTQPTPEPTYEKITLNVCKVDPENADYWSEAEVNVWDKPGGLDTGAVVTDKLPACDDLVLEILEKEGRKEGYVPAWKIRYQSVEGWISKDILTGEE